MKRLLTSGQENKFWSHVVLGDKSECWWWDARRNNKGYGQLTIDRKTYLAHRIAYEIVIGLLPDESLCLHSCGNGHMGCVNPWHLRPGTQRENMLDAVLHGRHNCARKTHCPSGHEYSGGNVATYSGKRYCRTCMRSRNKSAAVSVSANRLIRRSSL